MSRDAIGYTVGKKQFDNSRYTFKSSVFNETCTTV